MSSAAFLSPSAPPVPSSFSPFRRALVPVLLLLVPVSFFFVSHFSLLPSSPSPAQLRLDTCDCGGLPKVPTCCHISSTGRYRYTMNACACTCGRGELADGDQCEKLDTEEEECTCGEESERTCCQLEDGTIIDDFLNNCVCACNGGILLPLSGCM